MTQKDVKTTRKNNYGEKLKTVKIETRVKFLMICLAIISFIMFFFMFFEEALIDDGAFHLGRLAALSEDISLTNIKPWIYSKTYYGTGYPLGIFYPDLFLYPFALLAKTPIGVYASYIIMMMSINFASVASFYFCVKKILKNRWKANYEGMALVMALMYLAYPYRLWCLYVRMAMGECMFFVFFPIIMLGVYELFYNKKFSFALFVGMTGLIHSHILSTAICIVVLVVYYVINIKKLIQFPKIILYTVINAMLTILCGLSVILPILEMQSFTTMYYMTGEKTFGKVVEHTVRIINNDLAAVVCTVVAIIVCGVLAYKGKTKAKFASVSILVVFMWTDLFCWSVIEDIFPFINIIQFPFRLLGIAGFTLSILAGLILYRHKPLYVSIPVIIIASMMLFVMGKYVSFDGVDLYGEYSVGQGEYVTQELREYILENGGVPNVKQEYDIDKKGDVYTFKTKNGNVILPLAYYKGYNITDGNKTYSYCQENGLIKVEGVEGTELTVVYEGTKIQKISLGISILSFLSAIVVYVFYKKKEQVKDEVGC